MAAKADRGLASRIGPVEIDWPRSVGYFGGIALALAFEMIEPPLALVIAAVPFVKMLNVPDASRPVRLVSQLVDGASKPIGGDSDQTIRLRSPDVAQALPGKAPARRRGRTGKSGSAPAES